VEGVSTDCSTLVCLGGSNEYVENAIQKQGYTNKETFWATGSGARQRGTSVANVALWSGNEWVQVEYLNKKTAKDFIAGGTTQNQFRVDVVKRIGPAIEGERVVPARGVEGADLYGGGAERQHGGGAGYVLPQAEDEGAVRT